MKVAELMSRPVDLVDPSMSIRDAAIRMREDDVGALPVGENDRLVGVVSDRDIAMRGVAEGRAPGDCAVRDVMSTGVFYCFEEDDVARGAQVMAEHAVRRLPVLDSDKRLVGLLSLADLARAGVGDKALEAVSQPMEAGRV